MASDGRKIATAASRKAAAAEREDDGDAARRALAARYVAAVKPARAIGTTNSSDRPTPARRASHTPPPGVVISRGVSQARPTAVQASKPDQDEADAEEEPAALPGRRITDKQDRKSERQQPGGDHGGHDGGGRRGQAGEEQRPGPYGIDLKRHDGVRSLPASPAASEAGRS